MNVATTLFRTARRTPNAPAVFNGAEAVLCYADWADDVRGKAALLVARGCAPGDRVAICLRNRVDYLSWLYAVWCIGACAVPINRRAHPDELAWITAHCEARLCIADPELARTYSLRSALLDPDDPVRAMPRAAGPVARDGDDPAWLFYTSGTTGRPKGATLSHRNLLAMATSALIDFGPVSPDARLIAAAPCSHGAGLLALPFTMAGAAHVMPRSEGFDADEFVDLLSAHAHCHAFLVPTMLRRVVERVADRGRGPGAGLACLVYGGAPMPVADLRRALAVLGPRLAQLYGEGETPMTITSLPRELHEAAEDAVLRSAGYERTGVQVRVRRPDGAVCDPEEPGEVTVRGDTVMLGYWRDPAATAAAIRDGWLWTGDLGQMDADGLLTLTGRSKELIISGGSNIYPREIEEVLTSLDSVREAAVIGRPDPEWGEIVVACVDVGTVPGRLEPALAEACAARLARYKIPKRWVFGPLPKSPTGKIDKRALAARIALLDQESV